MDSIAEAFVAVYWWVMMSTPKGTDCSRLLTNSTFAQMIILGVPFRYDYAQLKAGRSVLHCEMLGLDSN